MSVSAAGIPSEELLVSYDISFFGVQMGLSLEQAFELKCCSGELESLSMQERAQVKQLIQLIKKVVPKARVFEEEDSIALVHNKTGLSITFFGVDHGAISFPYWEDDINQSELPAFIQQVFEILRANNLCGLQDSQLGLFLELRDASTTKDYLEKIAASNQETMVMLQEYFK